MSILQQIVIRIMSVLHKILLVLMLAVILCQCRKEMEPQVVNIPDNNFLNALIELGVDTNGDGKISPEEAEMVTNLDVSGSDILDLAGIEAFVNLDTLNCQLNQLSTLYVSKNTRLTDLTCGQNQLTTLDVSNNIALRKLRCGNNQLITLDVSSNKALHLLACSDNQITRLDFTNNTALEYLNCHTNQLTTLDVSNNTALNLLSCRKNQLTSLDISNNIALMYFGFDQNQLSTLNVSNNPLLVKLICDWNQLTSLDVSINTDLETLSLKGIPSLNKVCVGELPFPPTGIEVDTTGSPNVYFTIDCN